MPDDIMDEIEQSIKEDGIIKSKDVQQTPEKDSEIPVGNEQMTEKETPAPEKEKEEPEAFSIDSLNKKFKTQFKDENELTGVFDFFSKNNDAPSKVTELSKKLAETEALLNPMAHFKDEKEYVRQQIIIKHPEYDPGAVTKIISSDLEKMSPVDLLKYRMLIEDGDIFKNEQEALEMIASQYDVDVDEDLSSAESVKRNKLLKDAKKAGEFLRGIKNEFKIPDSETIAKERQSTYDSLKAQWKPQFDNFSTKLQPPKIVFKDKSGKESEFVFQYDDKFKEDISKALDVVVDDLAKRNADPKMAPEVLLKVADTLMNNYIAVNWKKIAEAYFNERMSTVTEEELRELHNPTSGKHGKAPVSKTAQAILKEQAEAQIEADLS